MSNGEAVHRLLSLLKAYKKTICVILCLLLVSTGLNLCIPLISSRIMDDGFIGGDQNLLIKLVLCALVIYLFCAAIDIWKEKKRVEISAKIQYFLSEQSFAHLMKLKVSYFDNKNYAEILNNINVDISNMTSIADESVFFVVTQAFSMIGGIIGLFILDYRMTCLVLVFIPAKYVIMKKFAQKRKRLMDSFIMESQKYAGWFGDTVGGVREVKLFGLFREKHLEFSDNQLRVVGRQKKLNMLAQWNTTADTVLVHMLTTMIYILGANLVFRMEMSIGSIFAFITYSAYVTGPISAILNIGYLMSGIIPSTKRYYAFMGLEEETENESGVQPQYGELVFQNVSFAYSAQGKKVLDNISFCIPERSKTALVGKNGSGKSTLVNLVLRLYEPTEGKIFLAGENIDRLALTAYRDMISVVSQDIYLFHDTIRNNICLYRQIEETNIMAACRDSGIEAFVDAVTLEYCVGRNGAKLSGGQKQKIALARALLYERPILILDEATSSADSISEQQVNALLHTRLKDKTVIVVTHRTDVLNEVDQVIKLENGREYTEKCL